MGEIENIELEKERSFNDYCDSLKELVDEYNVNHLLSKEKLFMCRDVYRYYPFIFIEAFEQIEVKTIRILSKALSFYYTYILLMDKVLDTRELPNGTLILFLNVIQRKVMGILQDVFPLNSEFWKYHEKYYNQYIKGILLERRNHLNVCQEYTEDEFHTISIGKTSLAKLAPATLGILIGNEEDIISFEKSHDNFALGRQLIDDIQDWKEDLLNKRFSYPIMTVISKNNLQTSIIANQISEEDIAKYFFYSGHAEAFLSQALEYFDLAKNDVKEINCPTWISCIESCTSMAERYRDDIKYLREKELSKIYINKRTKLNTSFTIKNTSSKNFEDAINHSNIKAVEYLIQKQDKDGFWRDFMVNSIGCFWTTGYIGYALREQSGISKNLDSARVALLKSRESEGGWGFNRHVISDADSTAWCILFILTRGTSYNELQIDFDMLRSHRHSDTGGISTYRKDKATLNSQSLEKYKIFSNKKYLSESHKSMIGWCSPHLCVTSVAVQAFCFEKRICEDDVSLIKDINYIKENQNKEGFWESYWWDGRIYGTANSIKALSMFDRVKFDSAIIRGMDWLSSVQQLDGGWNNGNFGESSAFNTALCVSLLSKFGKNKYSYNCEKGIKWLLDNQMDDGSWKSIPIMRVPYEDQLNPWEEINKKNEAILYRLTEDSRRLFTTATVVDALKQFQKNI
ncbi:MAG: prenyltransferase/squalene oxidase repeat-containing protein [Melioribacteraceae bacterium]